MSPGLLVALCLQAEPAPAEPAPAAPPAPASAPVATGAEEAEPPPPTYFLGLAFGGGMRLAPAADDVEPALGFAVSSLLGREYARLGPLEIGVAFHFTYARYAKQVTVMIPQGMSEVSIDDVRTVSHYDFSALQTIAVTVGPLRPFAALGAGVGLGHFATQEKPLRPGTARTTRPLLHGGLGVDVALPSPDTRVGVALDYARLFRKPTFMTDAGKQLQVFGDRLTASLWLRHAF